MYHVTPDNLKRARQLLGWSQSDLARVLDLTQATISRIENGPEDGLIRLNRRVMHAVRLCLETAGIPPARLTGPAWSRGSFPIQEHGGMTAEEFRTRRLAFGGAQWRFASALGISQAALSLYETDKRSIPRTVAMAARQLVDILSTG